MEKLLGKKYITPYSDVNELSNKIEYVRNNYNEVLTDFQEKFDYAKNKFTIENMVNETISVYKKVLR